MSLSRGLKRSFPAFVIAFILLAGSLVQGQTVEFFMANGQELLKRGAFSQAVHAFQQALAREPDYFEAQYNLGLSYLQWGKYSLAVTEIKKALRLQPRSAPAWSSLAIAYDNQNQNALSLDALSQAVNCDPGNTTARMNLALMYANARRYALAVTQYREVIKIEGTNSDALINLSRCLLMLGSIAEAKEYLRTAIAAQPDKGEAHSDLGDLYLKHEHDTDKAIAEYQAAIVMEQNNPNYYQQLAWAFECRDNTKEALDMWRKALAYADDPLKRDEIQGRIDRLEKGSGLTSPGRHDADGEQTLTKDQVKDLEREVRHQDSRGTRRIDDAKPVDISGDLQQIDADTSSSKWDITKDFNKRAAGKKR